MLAAVLHVPPVRRGQLGDEVEPEAALAGVAADRRRRWGTRRAVADLDQPGVAERAHGGADGAAAVPQGVGGHLVEGRHLPFDEGVDRLTAAVAELAGRPLPAMCDAVVEGVRPAELQDDVALVAVRLR